MSSLRRVVVVGGGIAALETVLALRALGAPRLAIELMAPEESLLYRPVTVAEAFDLGEARAFDLAQICREQQATHRVDAVIGVDASRRVVHGVSGARVSYDELVIALGARALPVVEGALTFRGRSDVAALRMLLDEIQRGAVRHVAFVIPGGNAWPLPTYELALLTASFVGARRLATLVTIVTSEDSPLEIFGSRASEAIAALLWERSVAVRGRMLARAFEGGKLHLAGGGLIAADRVVAAPQWVGPATPGLPHDGEGFIPVDAHGRVPGVDSVYAAGDVTAFPLKHGGLATQQADAVAEVIAQRAGVEIEPTPFSPVLRGLLLTGGAPIYLRAGPGARRPGPTVANRRRAEWAPRRARVESDSSTSALWWPPAKIAGRHIAPYFAASRLEIVASEPLTDTPPLAGTAEARDEDGAELALLLADYDARWGDYAMALDALRCAETLTGSLPADYDERRREWQRALASERRARLV